METLDFLESPEGEPEDTQPEAPEAEQPAEAVTEPEPATTEERPRDERGRFAPKGEQQPEAAESDQRQPHMVPLAALHEVRDELRSMKGRLAQYEHREQQPEPVQVPDPVADPQGYHEFQTRQFQDALYMQRLEMSQRFAEQQHGKELVEAALRWGVERCNADPNFNAMVKAQPDPVGFAIGHYEREQLASQITPEDLTQFRAWKAAQAQIAGQRQPAPAEPQSPTRPPVSIVSATSAGGSHHVATGPGTAFDATFQG